jgi:hypothetical protein
VGLLVLEGVSVRESDRALDAEVDGTCASFRERYGEGKSSEVSGTADVCIFYKALGIDFIKTRFSNEAFEEGLASLKAFADRRRAVLLEKTPPPSSR